MAWVNIKQLSEETGLAWQTVEIGTCEVSKRIEGGTLVMDRAEAIRAISDYCERKSKKCAAKTKLYGKGCGVERRKQSAREAVLWNKRSQKLLDMLGEGSDTK